MPHLDAAYSFALRLCGNRADAADIVQDAYLRAMRYFDTFRGLNARTWVLKIVRNQYYTWIEQMKNRQGHESLDEQHFGIQSDDVSPDDSLVQSEESLAVRSAVAALPPEFREVIVLRELEELDYKQIALVLEIPIGTVMSRLSRGRAILRDSLRLQLYPGP
ncbi:MAG: sigma-70 family RNA polymerase sigma factor [Bacteroidetes bacterium]|nr:sigma-70 family RNA polymerase sigma factor [Bacteroidota bacterium]